MNKNYLDTLMLLRERVTRTVHGYAKTTGIQFTHKTQASKAEKQQLYLRKIKIWCCCNRITVPNTWPYFCPAFNGESDRARKKKKKKWGNIKIHHIFPKNWLLIQERCKHPRPCHKTDSLQKFKKKAEGEKAKNGLTDKNGREYQVAADEGFTDGHDEVSKPKRTNPEKR